MKPALRALAPVVLLCLASCAAVMDDVAPEPVSPRSAQPQTLVLPKRPDRFPVTFTPEEYRAAMRVLLREVRVPRTTGAREQPFQVVPVSGTPLDVQKEALANAYREWCKSSEGGGDCLQALSKDGHLEGDGKYKAAFHFALNARQKGFTDELRNMATSPAVPALLMGAIVVYMGMLAFPELVTKGIAAAVTVVLVAWLGVQTLCNIVGGWIQMVKEVNAATTFSQVRTAGDNYGQIMGAETARLLVMVVTAAISEAGLVAKVLNLPSAAEASAALAADTGGLGLGVLEGVSGTQVVPGSGVTITLAPGASVAMAVAGAAGARWCHGSSARPRRTTSRPWRTASPPRGEGRGLPSSNVCLRERT